MEKSLNSKFIKTVREYLESEVGLLEANTEFFLYLLDNPQLAKFKQLLEIGKIEDIDSHKLITQYLKRHALLRKKVIVVADICDITDWDGRDCFIEETMARRNRFEPIDKTDIEQLKLYLKKVKLGMKTETAIQELNLNDDMLNFVTIRESSYWED